jgi:hypothetical protein
MKREGERFCEGCDPLSTKSESNPWTTRTISASSALCRAPSTPSEHGGLIYLRALEETVLFRTV